MAPIYIAIEGVIGVGKTTLARLLQPEYNAELVLEVFEENPFLAPFYADPERYAFQAQIVFLLSRYQQQRAVRERAGRVPILSDYIFSKDYLFAQMNLRGDEWETYQNLHHVLAERIVQPDLVVYLRASVDTLMARIAQRDRPYERSMSRDYIARLAQSYERFFSSYQATPLVTIDTEDLNVLTQEADTARVREQVRQAVNEGIYQQRLPLLEIPQVEQALPERERPGESRVRGGSLALDSLLVYLRLQEEIGRLATPLRQQYEQAEPAPEAQLAAPLRRSLRGLVQLAETLGIELDEGAGGSGSGGMQGTVEGIVRSAGG